MDPEAQVEALRAEHDRLDKQIKQELRHPSSDDLQLADMKREKLRLKDEIAALEQQIALTE